MNIWCLLILCADLAIYAACPTHDSEYIITPTQRWQREHTDGPSAVAFSPNASRNLLAVASYDNTISLFDCAGQLLRAIQRPSIPSVVAFSSQGTQLAIGSLQNSPSDDLTIHCIDVETGKEQHAVCIKKQPRAYGVSEVSYGPHDTCGVAVGYNGQAFVFEQGYSGPIDNIRVPSGIASSRMLTEYTTQSIARNGSVYWKALQNSKILETHDLKIIAGLDYSGVIGRIIASPHGRRCLATLAVPVAQSADHKSTFSFKISEDKRLQIRGVHGITAGAFSADELTCVTAHDHDITIVKKIPDTEDGDDEPLFLDCKLPYREIINDIACSSDGSLLCVTSAPHAIALYDVAMSAKQSEKP